jgi:hypothetical protein
MHGNNTGISLCSYLYLKLPKMPCFSLYLLCFFFYKIGEQEGGTGSAQGGGKGVGTGGRGAGKQGEMTQTLYAHMNKRKKKEMAGIFKSPYFETDYSTEWEEVDQRLCLLSHISSRVK